MDSFQHKIMAQAIDYLATLEGDYPALETLARKFGYDPTHFQKAFAAYVGVSPKKMIQYMQYKNAREFLLKGYPTLEAAYAAGLSGNGRLHDLFVTCEAATPGMVARKGKGMEIYYGFHPTPCGDVLIGVTKKGICWLGFAVNGARDIPLARMRAHWPEADYVAETEQTGTAAGHILSIWRGDVGAKKSPLSIYLHGTNFQIQVWQALLKIPAGATVSYQAVAENLNMPNASRAVGGAVGANPISLLIPCHRVIQKSGIVANYGWGTPRKKLLLAMESADVDL